MSCILIASDHAGFKLKEKLRKFLEGSSLKVADMGTYSKERCDYPELAASLAQQISQGRHKRGILICKSGIGNSIVANRFPGVRAALCYTVRAARLSRQHNDSNVLVLGAGFTPYKEAAKIVSAWLKEDFEGGRHARRLDQIKRIEQKLRFKR